VSQRRRLTAYDGRVRLTPWEEDRLLVFAAAELARRHRAAGLALNAPEAVALICDAMFEAARAGQSYEAVAEAGRRAVEPTDVMDGVAGLVDEVRLEVLLEDGTRLIVLDDPLRRAVPPSPDLDGGAGDSPPPALPERETVELAVVNRSDRPVRVSSHYPFEQVNPRLDFERARARGFRLDLPAGATQRWAPGEERVVRLVRYGGTGGQTGERDVAE
jgi:urease subunit gamma/beta